MERSRGDSFSERDPVTEAEIRLLHESAAQLLVRRGHYREAPGVYTPHDRPDALEFRLEVPVGLIRSLYFADDNRVEIDAEGCYLTYTTPHIKDPLGPDVPESNVYLNINGSLRHTDVTFSIGVLLSTEEDEGLRYTAEVFYEYARGGRVLEEETIELDDEVVALDSRVVGYLREDADRFRRLLIQLERLY